MSKFKPTAIAIGTSDRFGRCPLRHIGTEPITFIGIGTPGAAHALSIVSDLRPVGRIVLVDFLGKQLGFTEKLIRSSSRHNGNPELVTEEVYGTRIAQDTTNWGEVDIDAITSKTGVGLWRRENCNRYVKVEMPYFGDAKPWSLQALTSYRDIQENSTRLNYGCLLDGASGVSESVPVEQFVGPMSDAIRQLHRPDEHTVIWLSNACKFTIRGRICDRHLHNATVAADRAKNTRLWLVVARKEFTHRRYHLGVTPNFRYIERQLKAMAEGLIVEIQANAGAGKYQSQLMPGITSIGWKTFQKAPIGGDVAYLHSLSLAGSKLGIMTDVCRQAMERFRRVVVFEHNRFAVDRKHLHNSGFTKRDIEAAVGQPAELVKWARSDNDVRRNMLVVFKGKG